MSAALQEVFFCFKRLVTKMPDFQFLVFKFSFKEDNYVKIHVLDSRKIAAFIEELLDFNILQRKVTSKEQNFYN